MKFLIGYQNRADRSLIDAVLKHRGRISEVYFPWGNFTSGRGRVKDPGGQEKLEAALAEFHASGIGLNLLLNGNCYGAKSLARDFYNAIGDAADELRNRFGLGSVTTTSPVIARFLKANFPFLEVRASVNMEIGTARGMEYLAEWFDGYYLKREFNHRFDRIRELRAWCDAHGKKLYVLANSGCLNDCSAHNFHDNLVAHEEEMAREDNAFEFHGVCRDYLKRKEHRETFFCDTNFIRPEDLPLCEGLFDGVKLATRTNRNPAAVVEAYLSGRFRGNLPELMEPDHSASFYPLVIENERIPAGFGEHLLHCGKRCDECGYCTEVLKQATRNLGEPV